MARMLNDIILDHSAVTADKTSEIVDLLFIKDVSVQCTWTSTTAAGTFKLLVSNDGTNFEELSSPTQAVNNDSGTKHLILQNCPYHYLKVFFDYTSGTVTTLKAIINGKGY